MDGSLVKGRLVGGSLLREFGGSLKSAEKLAGTLGRSRGSYWKSGTRGLLVGQCGLGHPELRLVLFVAVGSFAAYFRINIYYYIVPPVCHCS